MKVKMFFSLFCFSLAITGKTLAADITITGETNVNSSTTYTYYATPPTPGVSGTIYTWQIDDGTIVDQNTDPNAGPLYCVVQWRRILGTGAVNISDNQGNSGILFVTLNGFSSTDQKKSGFPVKQLYQPLAAINNKIFMVA